MKICEIRVMPIMFFMFPGGFKAIRDNAILVAAGFEILTRMHSNP